MISALLSLFIGQEIAGPVLTVEVDRLERSTILGLLKETKKSVVIGARTIDDPKISLEISRVRKRGVKVILLVEAKDRAGISAADKAHFPRGGFLVIDERLLWMGSANWNPMSYKSSSLMMPLNFSNHDYWSSFVRRAG
ncbi:hypothetical protein BH11ARM1_BH11ARM1_15410 [soil metagenome]